MRNDRRLTAWREDEDLPCLPSIARTKNGMTFNPHLDIWAYRDNTALIHLNFSSIQGVSPVFIQGMKTVLVWYAENLSSGSLAGAFERIKKLCRMLVLNRSDAISTITSVDLINYRASLDINNSGAFGALSSVLKRWYRLGVPGVSADAQRLLEQLRIKGNEKGVAVLTMDATNGPFTDVELQAIGSALNNAYAAGKVDVGRYVLTWLFILLGQRPVQYASLKVCDVTTGMAKDGSPRYSLQMPRAKQGTIERTEFKDRLIIPQIGKLLAQYAAEIKLKFVGVLADPSQAPLFPQREIDTVMAPDGFRFHRTAGSIGSSLAYVLETMSVPSERTGKALHVNARRFRYTIGTRAAAEGHRELVIAEILDHTDTQNVGVYVQSTPEMLERIDRAMALVMAPMAQAFSGELIHDESEAVRGNDPRSRIVDPRFDTSFKPMGNCGSHSFCSFAAPIACYTCRSFQPWLDGHHEGVLDHLISERERLKVSADMRIASVNDRTILAVAQVVILCQEMRKKMNGGDNRG